MSDARSRILDGLSRLVAHLTRRVDYLALYPCRVVAQRDDRSLDLHAEDARLGSPAAVPVRWGLPGVVAVVPAGTRVLLGFEDGDPSRPVAMLWEYAEVTALQINAGSTRVARQGEDVTSSASLSAWMLAVTTRLNSGAGAVPSPPSSIGTVAGGTNALRVP